MGEILASADQDFSPGQIVLFGKHAGVKIKGTDRTCLLLASTDILAVLEG